MRSAKHLEKAAWLNSEILSSSVRSAVTGANTAGSRARIGRQCTAAVVLIELVGLFAPAETSFENELLTQSEHRRRDWQPFRLIGIQQRIRDAAQDAREFPAQVVSILNSRVEPLASRRRVHMCSITGHESSPHMVAFHHTRVRGPVQPHPLNRLYVELAGAESAIDETTNAISSRLSGFGTRATGRGELERESARKRTERQNARLGERPAVSVRPIQFLDLDVGHDSRSSIQIVPDDWNLERLANKAAPAVTPHEKFASDSFFAGRTEHGRNDVVIILLETLESHTMLGRGIQIGRGGRGGRPPPFGLQYRWRASHAERTRHCNGSRSLAGGCRIQP